MYAPQVEAYRSEATAASGALHAAVERLTVRLHGEEAAIERARMEAANQAQAEAVQLGNMRGQVGALAGAGGPNLEVWGRGIEERCWAVWLLLTGPPMCEAGECPKSLAPAHLLGISNPVPSPPPSRMGQVMLHRPLPV